MRKLFSLLLVAAMVLGLFGTIGVAHATPVFPDIAGNAAEKDIVKLYTLGIIGGYPDGTFKPDGNITRAEFAKIAVLSLGKSGSANLLKNTASLFKDVPAGQWYTGYVNVAVANGIIKGYDDGTFKPDNNITEAEAVTMLLRALGYNDNLPGNWPLNYVMKAADLGIIGDGFVADAKATRAFVCTSAMATLGQTVVAYNTETKTFNPGNTTLLAGLKAESVSDAVAGAYDATNGTLVLGGTAYKLAAGATVVTGEAYGDLANKHVKFIKRTNADGTPEIVYLEVVTPVVAGKVTAVDAVNNAFTLSTGKVVTLGSSCTITKNGAAANLIDINGSDVTALLGSDGKAYSVVAYKLDITGSLTGKTTTAVSGTTTNKITVNGQDYVIASTTTIVRNGTVASFADLKTGDDIKMSANGTTAVYVDAFAMTKDGVIASYATTPDGSYITTVTLQDGTVLTAAPGSTSGTTLVSGTTLTLAKVGQKATFVLDRNGKITNITNIVANSLSGKITALSHTVSSTDVYTITLDNGSTYTAAASAAYTLNKASVPGFSALEVGDYAALTLDSSGKYTQVDAYKDVELTASASGNTVPTAVTNCADSNTTYSINGVSKTITDIQAMTTGTIRVKWAKAGVLASLVGVNFAKTDLTVTGFTTNVSGSTTTTIINTLDISGGSVPVTLGSSYKVMKDGVASDFNGIAIGQKLAVDSTTNATYIEVTTDADAPVINIATNGQITSDEPLASLSVTVDGVALDMSAFTAGSVAYQPVIADGTHVIGVLAKDYAGNVATNSVSKLINDGVGPKITKATYNATTKTLTLTFDEAIVKGTVATTDFDTLTKTLGVISSQSASGNVLTLVLDGSGTIAVGDTINIVAAGTANIKDAASNNAAPSPTAVTIVAP